MRGPPYLSRRAARSGDGPKDIFQLLSHSTPMERRARSFSRLPAQSFSPIPASQKLEKGVRQGLRVALGYQQSVFPVAHRLFDSGHGARHHRRTGSEGLQHHVGKPIDVTGVIMHRRHRGDGRRAVISGELFARDSSYQHEVISNSGTSRLPRQARRLRSARSSLQAVTAAARWKTRRAARRNSLFFSERNTSEPWRLTTNGSPPPPAAGKAMAPWGTPP